jgi:hypothetical protein
MDSAEAALAGGRGWLLQEFTACGAPFHSASHETNQLSLVAFSTILKRFDVHFVDRQAFIFFGIRG